ncbi:ATP-binding protein [Streptomyces massasporeus]
MFGPVGVGNSHVAQALGQQIVRQGANVRFTNASRILAELAGRHADRTWDRHIRELIDPDLLILDNFATRQLSASQADDPYELVSERQGQSLIITSNRAPSDWYPLFPNPVVAESLLDRLTNSSHQVMMSGPVYWPNKRPKGAPKKWTCRPTWPALGPKARRYTQGGEPGGKPNWGPVGRAALDRVLQDWYSSPTGHGPSPFRGRAVPSQLYRRLPPW